LTLLLATFINVSSIKLLKIYKEKRDAMIIKSNVKAGGLTMNHNEKVARDKKSLTVKSGVKAGGIVNHNEKIISDKKVKSFTVKSGVKSGGIVGTNHNEKLADENRSIEQKKTIGKKLRLSKETIRELRDGDLKAVAGGRPAPTSICTDCTCDD
jgi:hypothetical protein